MSVAEVADTLIETGSSIVCMSTYNGMAYSFGKDLLECLDEKGLGDAHVLMGGRLNEPLDGSDVPIDCTDRMRDMGINVDNDVDAIVDAILAFAKADQEK